MLDTSSAPNPLTPLSFLRLVLPELLCALLFLVIGASLGEVAPFNGAFFEQDPSLSKDYRASTVPTWLLGVLCAALPGAALAVLEPLSLHRSQRGGCRCPLFLCAGLALALGVMLSFVVPVAQAIAIRASPETFNDLRRTYLVYEALFVVLASMLLVLRCRRSVGACSRACCCGPPGI